MTFPKVGAKRAASALLYLPFSYKLPVVSMNLDSAWSPLHGTALHCPGLSYSALWLREDIAGTVDRADHCPPIRLLVSVIDHVPTLHLHLCLALAPCLVLPVFVIPRTTGRQPSPPSTSFSRQDRRPHCLKRSSRFSSHNPASPRPVPAYGKGQPLYIILATLDLFEAEEKQWQKEKDTEVRRR